MTRKEQKEARLGESRAMHNGMEATIIEYRKSTDIDVRFADGSVRKHCGYQEFKSGYISHPDNTRDASEARRVGEKRKMKNGLTATLITYRSSASVDVRFDDDGVEIHNVTYATFNEGKVGHPDSLHASKKKNRVGETRTMFNGMKATIVEYRLAHDLDIEFEDGVVREHCAYKEFCSGNIAHPNDIAEAQALARIGEKRYMTCGLEATIVEYRSYKDVDVEFEDGTIAKHKSYGNFLEGSIAHPKAQSLFGSLQETVVGFYLLKFGFVKTSKGDLKHLGFGQMELDFYHKKKKIAIEVDGEVHKLHNQYERDIRKNRVCADNNIKLYRLRDKALPMIENSTSRDYVLAGKQFVIGFIDCKKELDEILISNGFMIESDTIDYERDFAQIMRMHAKHYFNKYKKKRIGEKVFHKVTNQYITIIDYMDYNNITVKWDDGAVAKEKNYGAFKRGEIQHPVGSSERQANDRLGEEKMMSCGGVAKIVNYRNAEDIDIKFDDNTVVEHATYYNFSKGTVWNPNIPHTQSRSNRVGEEATMSCGQKATIIKYRNQYDMDIQFDDGEIRSGVQYEKFKRGSVLHPTATKEAKASSRIGETRMMNCGLSATIIAYRTSHDIDVQFEDGMIVEHRKYSRFQAGAIGYPKTT